MRILEKYVLKHYVAAFLFCIVLLIVLGIIGDILGFLDDIVKNGIPLSSIFSFYLYLAPFAFVNMVPFACLLSAVYVFNSFSKHQEVTAVIASGISLWKLLQPVLVVTFLVCLATFIVNDKLVPSTMEKANRIRQEKLEHDTSGRAKEIQDVAIYGKGDKLIYAKSYTPATKTLNSVIIHLQDEKFRVKEKISARLAVWQNEGYWRGKDVLTFKMDEDGNFVGDPEVSKEKKLFIQEKPKAFLANQWDPKFMSYMQLKKYIEMFKKGSPDTVRRLLVDLNYKLALPFTALITVLVGVPFSIETGRASALIGMARGISIAIIYLPIMAVCLALGKSGVLPPGLSAWLSNILFALFGAYFVSKKT